jgi:hypothetical protein
MLLSLAITAIPLFATCWLRNPFWEYCTTRAYGFPMPWYIAHCLCGKGKPPVDLRFLSINLAVWIVAGLLLAGVLGKRKKQP